jgi:hypothetical protein
MNLVEGDNFEFGVPLLSVTGVDSATISVTPLDGMANNAALRCIVTNTCGTLTSDPAEFTVEECCIGDHNFDGGVDGADIDSFFIDWEAGVSSADVNLDGGVDGSDVDVFFGRWEAGC